MRELGKGKSPGNPEATGYMLRGFFEALRRHIAFERDHLLAVLRDAGRKAGRTLIEGQWMKSNRLSAA